MELIYAAMYNDCVYESSASPISLHKTQRGAEMAIEFHKKEIELDHLNLFNDDEEYLSTNKYDWARDWFIEEYEILD